MGFRAIRSIVMHRPIVIFLAICACSHPPALDPQQRKQDSAAAIVALQGSRFEDAGREASAVLARDAHNSQAAAVRAITSYQAAAHKLVSELSAIIDRGEYMKVLDHEQGRAVWRDFATALDAVDKDLAVVAEDQSFSLELCLACWEHDWNRNGQIDDRDRKLFEVEFDGKGGELPEGDPRRRPTYRFDVGDAEWARAMVSFQRAFVEIVLAYRWNELDKLFSRRGSDAKRLVIHLGDADGVRRARKLILAGLEFSDRARAAYLAETDDDREWLPNPRQKNHPMPLEMDAQIYETWAKVTGDLRRMIESQEGLSIKEIAALLDKKLGLIAPDAYIDIGRMLGEPMDIVIGGGDEETTANLERVLRDLLGHGYQTSMKRSPLVGRLRLMMDEVDHGQDTFERKLRYLLWVN
jgi:hypothetical protein